MQSPQKHMKISLACLNNVCSRQEDYLEKEKIKRMINKYEKDTFDPRAFHKQIEGLNDVQKKVFHLLYDVSLAYRDSYPDLIKEDKEGIVDKTLDFTSCLLGSIGRIKLFDEKLTKEDTISKFYIDIRRNLLKVNQDVLKKWREKATQKLNTTPPNDLNMNLRLWSNAITAVDCSQPPPKIPERKSSQQQSEAKPAPRKIEPDPARQRQRERDRDREREKERERERERERDRQRQRQQKQRERQQRERDRQQQKIRRRNEENEERKKEVQKKRKEDEKKRADQGQFQRLKLKSAAIQNYIENKRSLQCQKSKIKDISQYIAIKLDQFLKTAVQKMYDIASLKNKKNMKTGNELGYFADENGRVQYQQEFYYQPSSTIYALSYKHKHVIYSALRQSEIKKEEELRSALEAKTNEGDKKIDKKVENYILRPRAKESDSSLIPYTEIKDAYRNDSGAINISLQHVIFYLENHDWLKNSVLLFNVYHRF